MKVIPNKLMNDSDLVTTLMRLKEFRPADGCTCKSVVDTEPAGGSRVRFVIQATPDIGLVYEIDRPPSEEQLRFLYLESVRIAVAASLAEENRGLLGIKTGVNIGGLILDFPGIGFDQ